MMENPIRSMYSVRKITPSEGGRWDGVETEDGTGVVRQERRFLAGRQGTKGAGENLV